MSALVLTMRLLLAVFFVTTQAGAASLADLGENRRGLEAEADLNDEEQWELNQVYMAAKLSYMVEKPNLLASRPWVNETQVFIDDSDPRWLKKMLTRTTDRACYFASSDPFEGHISKLTVEEFMSEVALEAFDRATFESDKVCTVRGAIEKQINYTFRADLLLYTQQCFLSGKRLVLTGHGGGGAMATLGALLFAELNPWLITFGSPPVFKDDCPHIAPERTVRIVNTEVGTVFPAPEATEKEVGLVYDIRAWSWEMFQQAAAAISMMSGQVISDELIAVFEDAALIKKLLEAGVSPMQYLDPGNLHPPGGVTFLPPFPLRNNPSSAYVPDPEGQNDPNMKPYLYWYKEVIGQSSPFYPESDMRKYYYKIKQLWLQGRLGISMGFEHGTFCGDTKQCIDPSTTCDSLPSEDSSPKYCLYNHTAMETMMMPCMIDLECMDGFCVDGMCSQGMEGDFCFDSSQCVGQICVRGRCSTGVKGQPCQQETDCELQNCEVRQIDSYPLCWNTNVPGTKFDPELYPVLV